MKKLLLVGALTLGAASCAPDIKQDPAPEYVVAQFDPAASPAVVPSPNDLAIDPATGLVNAPIDPKATAAQQEFTKDYVNSLNGFPTSLPATTTIVGLDKNSVSPSTVRFIDLLAGTPIATPSVTPTIAYDADANQLVIAPPAGGWPKGGRYAVALIGGDNGLKGAKGEKVVGSPVWSLASLQKPLVTCEDLTAPDCAPTTDLIPAESTDPVIHLQEQTAAALQLEQLRRAYAPLLDAVAAQGVKREDIVLLWTFRIMNMPEATFNLDPVNPANSVVPFPNNLLLADAGKPTQHVNLPIPSTAPDLQKQLLGGLNTLDGFSTTAPIISENSDTLGPIEAGSRLDANSLKAGAKFYKLAGLPKGGTEPNVTACINCASSNPAASTQQLQFVPQVPLDERSTYAAVMTTDLKDEKGRFVAPPPTFALLRLSNPLSVGGKSQVSVLSDAQAAALEPLRAGFKPMFDALAAAKGLPRSKIALAWAFTTQSTVTIQQQLYGLASQYGAAPAPKTLLATPLGLDDKTASLLAAMGGLPKANIGQIFQGTMLLPFALTGTDPKTGVPTGTLDPKNPRADRVPFLLVLPQRPAPEAEVNWPVAIFSHGLRGWHQNVLAIANELAKQGYATFAYDAPFHGERSTCAGAAAALGLPSDDAACAATSQRCETNATKTETYGRCVAQVDTDRFDCSAAARGPKPADIYCSDLGQGRCLSDNKCEGGTFKLSSSTNTPIISGWNFLNLNNLFATRDNFRQHTIDLGQAMRVIASADDKTTNIPGIDTQLTAANGGVSTKLDETKVVYLGQSLGGLLGTISTSVAPNVGNVVLNVPGGDLTGILLTSPAFEVPRTAFLKTLENQNIKQGTPAFDQFLGLAKMILDPADPQNYSYYVLNGPATNANRSALLQYITNDEIIPNPLTQKLIDAANNRAATDKKLTVSSVNPSGLTDRHGYLLNFTDAAVTTKAQTDAVTFLKTGALP